MMNSSLEGLSFLWLELTPRCNLACTHCYADSGPRQPLSEGLGHEDWIEAMRQARSLGCRSLQFIGGEPTLYPRLPELIACARKLGFTEVEVYTNGTVLTEGLKDVFVHHRVSLAVSVYASREAVHDAVTLRPGSFRKTLEFLRWAVHSGLRLRVSVIEMEANRGEIEPTGKMLEALGVTSFGVDRVRGVGRGRAEAKGSSYEELCGHCWEGKLCLTSTGVLYPCVFARFYPVGSLHGGLERAVEGDRLWAFRARVRAMAERTRPCKPDRPPPPPEPCRPTEPPEPCRPTEPPEPCRPTEPPEPCRPTEPPEPCKPIKPPWP